MTSWLALRRCFLALAVFALAQGPVERSHAEEDASIEARLRDSAVYLSSDELEGRGVGTKGIDLAADYLARQFKELGLKTDVVAGTPFQQFKVITSSKLGNSNSLGIIGPPTEPSGQRRRFELKLREQFNPLAIGGSGKFDLPLAFVGYGITAKDENYDDYAAIDVQGKAVIVLRHEPQQDNPHITRSMLRSAARCPTHLSMAPRQSSSSPMSLTSENPSRIASVVGKQK
jgi:hypothetical protein